MNHRLKSIFVITACLTFGTSLLTSCQIGDISSEVSVINDKVADLLSQLEQLQKEVKDLKAEYSQKIEELNKIHQDDVSSINQRINENKDQFSALKSDYDRTILALNQKDEELTNKLSSLRTEYEENLALLKHQDSENQAAIALLRSEYEQKVQEFEQELKEQEEEIAFINQTLASYQSAYEAKMAELDAKNTEITTAINSLKEEYHSKVIELEEKIESNKASIESFEGEYQLKVAEIETTLTSLNKNLVSLEADYQEKMENLKTEYEAKLSLLQANYDGAITEINTQLVSLSESDKAILDRIAALEAKVNELSEIKTYTITFDPDNGDEIFTQLVTERTLLQKPSYEPMKEGYSFVGWFDPSGDKWLFSQSDVKTDMTLKAVYVGNEYEITLDPNGGTVAQSTVTVQFGQPYHLNDAVREGFDFAGWTYQSNFITNFDSYDIASNVTYTAKYNRSFQISFDTDGGDYLDPIENYGEKIGELPTPVKEGFRFAGWYLGSTKVEEGYVHTSQSDFTLMASWINAASLFEYQSIDGSLKLLKYVGSYLDVEIPSSIDGKPVIELASKMFEGKEDITSVSIPASITSATGALEGCSAITTIKISSSVSGFNLKNLFNVTSYSNITKTLDTIEFLPGFTSFPDSFFTGATRTFHIILPKGMTELPSFQGNKYIKSINIPEGVTSIDDYAFNGCNLLTSITIPEGVTSIGSFTFSSCSSLNLITIPVSVTSIGYGAFRGCSSLTSITIPDRVTLIDYDTFYGCSSLTSIKIPEGVTSINSCAFRYCSSLTSITIPEGVTSIDSYTFDGCTSLTSITIPEGVFSIGYAAFLSCSSLSTLTYLGTMEEWNAISKDNAWAQGSSISSIVCSDGVINM
ncbi:MAG: leucine-rich repeat protein [Candidatus Enterosoma sp.]|nr:leucine-rich repeat protein [Candidatus Enterosoma sp.]